MSHFFKVKTLDEVLALRQQFLPTDFETVDISASFSRILAKDLTAPRDLPGFRRATMDGFAVNAAATFGASESTPAWLEIQGSISMGRVPDFELAPGRAARIATGGMLPRGADAVVMVEHTQTIDDTSVEIYKSVAPLQHVIDADEDFRSGDVVLPAGTFIRPQEAGLAAGMGFSTLSVHRVPTVGIISTGDEIIPIDQEPSPGRIRDINSYTLSGFVHEAHATAVRYGITKDDPDRLRAVCEKALARTDMVLISGGSSVGTRDFTVEVLSALPDTRILVHGMSVSPGKPTILAKSGSTPVWGLPGQVVSAMVVMKMVVMPFLNRIQGYGAPRPLVRVPAKLTRNVASAQGRRDFIRVTLTDGPDGLAAKPVLGKSGLIRTMVHADGLLDIKENLEGLEKNTWTRVILL
ncbi:MAG: molybdopterin molybdotransferase MoeA [Desulfotignum sp.]|nr:molybdopterin molybdotransferase MoeA [Desulfotignum sp.]MCF8113578.1 molybdopterin molybdotransferase MoeA [Desulfotignum sp.]MCF8124881.1 molybdopterin molybdotransferase MoeA [Desulfotignum sp.]